MHPSDPANIGPEWERITYWLYHSSGKVSWKRRDDAGNPLPRRAKQIPVHPAPVQYKTLTDEELEEYLTLTEIVEYSELPLGIVLSLFAEWRVSPVGHFPKSTARYEEKWARKLKEL